MEVKVKTYATPEAANADAQYMAANGWVPAGATGGGSHASPLHGARKSVNAGIGLALVGVPPVFGLLGRKKWRQSDPISITWMRTPEAKAEADERGAEWERGASEFRAAKVERSEQQAREKREARAAKRERMRERVALAKARRRSKGA